MPQRNPQMLEMLHRATADLDPPQLRALATILGFPAGSPSSARLQRELALPTARATELERALGDARVADSDAGSAQAALEILAQERAKVAASAGQVEIVCTAPLDLGIPVRATLPKALEMIDAAEEEIVMVGYAFSEGARELLSRLVAAQTRGVRVTLVANRLREQLQHFVRLWPVGARLPALYTREANPNDDMAALHAKLLICDSRTALVTSANFTHHGLRGNIEIGICVTDAAIGRLADFVSQLIAGGEVLALKSPQ